MDLLDVTSQARWWRQAVRVRGVPSERQPSTLLGMAEGDGGVAAVTPHVAANEKTCFVISEFGTDERTKVERTQTLKHLVRKVLAPMGYKVERADEIDDPG